MEEIVFLNGKFLKLNQAKVSIAEPGLLCGYGLFETMRSCGGKIVYFEEHMRRLAAGAQSIGLRSKYTAAALKKAVKETVTRNAFKDAYVRLTLWKAESGAGVSIITRKYSPHSVQKYQQGFSACISSYRQNENSFFARIKTTSRILYQLSLQEAEKKGFDEAILLNGRGLIAEGTRSNIFLVKDAELFTPSLDCGCLDGITRKAIFDLAKKHHLKISEGKFTVRDLLGADEVFLTNSLMGVKPLTSIEGKSIGVKQCRKITQFLVKKYHSLLK
jgi:branched-subunit amino acid aminotransferase/4-amino-4-deoxychorismate lyase